MSLTTYISFFILILIIVFAPGPMTIFMMINGMSMHYKKIFPILIGANHAYLFSIILFSLGLNQLLQQNIIVLKTLEVIGSFYLIYFAFTQWSRESHFDLSFPAFEIKKFTLYRKGMTIALLNPKTIILFSLVLPKFVDKDRNYLLQILILGITFLGLQFFSGCAYAFGGRYIKHKLKDEGYQNSIRKISATILIMLALFLFIKS